MARPEKVEAVREIAARFEEADAALLTEYRGLRVAEIAEVRGALREANAEYKVLKNTLARIAVREAGLEDLVQWLEGPTAIVFVKGDVVEAAKALDDAAKKYPVLIVKGGTLRGGKLIDADQAQALAKLDSRDVLLTKIAMLFNQPAQQTVNVFSALLRDLGSMLGQVLAKKEEEGPAPSDEPATEAPSDEPATEAPSDEPATEAPSDEPAASGEPAAEEAPAAQSEGAEPNAQTTGSDEASDSDSSESSSDSSGDEDASDDTSDDTSDDSSDDDQGPEQEEEEK